jgi:hypothetical protein
MDFLEMGEYGSEIADVEGGGDAVGGVAEPAGYRMVAADDIMELGLRAEQDFTAPIGGIQPG